MCVEPCYRTSYHISTMVSQIKMLIRFPHNIKTPYCFQLSSLSNHIGCVLVSFCMKYIYHWIIIMKLTSKMLVYSNVHHRIPFDTQQTALMTWKLWSLGMLLSSSSINRFIPRKCFCLILTNVMNDTDMLVFYTYLYSSKALMFCNEIDFWMHSDCVPPAVNLAI